MSALTLFFFFAYKAPLLTAQFPGILAEWSSQFWMAARFHAPPAKTLASICTRTDGDCNSIFPTLHAKHLHKVGVMWQKVYRNSCISRQGLWYPGNNFIGTYRWNTVHSYLPNNATTINSTVELLSGSRDALQQNTGTSDLLYEC